MNCRDIEEIRPLYLSQELEEARCAQVREHLAECRSCAEEMDRQTALDARLRGAICDELPDSTAVERMVRRRIGAQHVRRLSAMAAAILFAAVLGYLALRPKPLTRLYADAALDHRQEVMEHQPRHWRSEPAEIEKLAARYQLSDVRALAPAGFRLEHAKMCGIDGKPALHLVYTNGSREYSIFIRARIGSETALHAVRVGPEQVAEFQTDRLEAVIATDGSNAECLQFARSARSAL